MSISPAMTHAHPPADHGLDSQQVFERKGRAYPVGPSWSPECDGSNLCVSFERPCYRVGPSTGTSPVSSRSSGTTVRTPRSDVETSRVTGPPWRALPAEMCALKPPPAAKGGEVSMPPAPSASPAPSESPAPQSTYVSPPIIYAQPRPWKPEQGAGLAPTRRPALRLTCTEVANELSLAGAEDEALFGGGVADSVA